LEDQEIIARLSGNDEQGMEQLIQKYGGLLRYVAGGILRDSRETEECVSDICVTVWQRAAAYDPERASLPTWLTTIARNAAINRQRAAHRREDGLTELSQSTKSGGNPEEEILRHERTERLKKALSVLDTRSKALFYRKYYYLQSTAQIAAELGMTERAVEGKLYRLRKRLQKALGGECDGGL
jgi:RNA polymerase sigma factor (sigma-70 family)